MSDESKVPEALRPFAFKTGQTGNASGRPKGYERRLREVVEGEEVDHPIDKTLGKVPAWEAVVLKAVDDAINGSPTARQHARSFLADRLIGKPKQDIRFEDVTPVDTEKVADLSEAQLEILAAIGVGEKPH